MKNVLITLVLFCCTQMSAQKDVWSVDVSKHGFMNQLDNGKILLKDKAEMSLIDNLTGKVEWKNNIGIENEPQFLDEVPIMYFDGKSFAVVDASSGTVIAESAMKTTVLDAHYFWEEGRVLMELNRDKNLEILNIDLNDLGNSWTTKVGKIQKGLMGIGARSTKNSPSIATDGTCILVDKKFVSFLSANGTIKNRLDFDDNINKLGYNTSKDILYVLEDKKILHFIDVASAKTVFTKELKEKNPDFDVLSGGNSVAYIQKDECHIVDAVSGSSVGVHKSKDKISAVYNDPESGKYLLISKKQLRALNIENGEVLQEVEVDTDFAYFQEANDKLFILGRGRANEISINDLSLKYEKSPVVSPLNSAIDLSNGRLYTYLEGVKFKMIVVDHNGKKIWDKEIESTSRPSVDIIKEGLLVIGGEDAHYLGIDDGKSMWKKSIKTGPSFSYVINKENQNMIMYADKRLYHFNTSSGTLSRSEDSFKFKDFDYDAQSPQLLLTDNKVFLKGSNSIHITTQDGSPIYSTNYKKADNSSGLMKLANLAVSTAAMASGNADEVVTVYQDGNEVHKGSMVDGLNDNWAYSEGAAADRRARQNRSSSGFPYVFTKLESGDRGLIFLDPTSGEEKFSVTMKEKSPNYIIDEVDGMVFYLNKTKLKAIDIK